MEHIDKEFYKDLTPCEFWNEIEDDNLGSTEWCEKHQIPCGCCGALEQCDKLATRPQESH
jgi:hypothetical protein